MYQIAIPSYKRENTLPKKTLQVLEKHKIDPAIVTIFVANDEEKEKYYNSLKDTSYGSNIVVGVPGIGAVRNFIQKYYPEKTKVVNLDDDLIDIKYRVNEKKLDSVHNLSEQVFERGFNYCEEHGSNLWGIYAAANPYFMKKDLAVGLYYIIGSCWGNIIRHDKDLVLELDDKEDYERTLQYYKKDGVVCRLDNITVKSNYYTEPGGMQVERTSERIHKSAENLVERFPDLCTMYIRKTTGHAELRLRDTRVNAAKSDTVDLENFM